MDQDSWDEDPVTQLPEVIEPGSIDFTLWSSALGGDPVANDISFTWDGQHTADWWQDISSLNHDLSPASSAPAWGVVSWPDGNDVLISYSWPDLGMQGHDRLPGAAPTVGDPSGATTPQRWITFGETLLNFVLLDLGAGRETPEEWSAAYYDAEKDIDVDFHDIFRAYLESADGGAAGASFDEWFGSAIAAGTYGRS